MANSVVTNIRTAIKYRIGLINGAGAYNLDVKGIGDPPRDIENMSGKLPWVNLEFGPEENENKFDGPLFQAGANVTRLLNRFSFTMDWFLTNINDPALEQEKALADSQYLFGNNYYIPDSNDDRTVFACIYSRSERFGLRTNTPNCGISVEFMVWYRQQLNDPTILS